MALMWEDINIGPLLQQFQIPSLSLAEMSSLNNFKAWEERQKFCHDIAFLLVPAKEEATGDRKYGLSTIWVNPSQARVPSMEEAVGKLTAWTSSGPNWPYTLVWLHKGTHHVPLPKEGHLDILPQRGVEVTPCRWISQLEVCQLLITSPQVTYLIGLNGCEESIITSLPEPMANGVSLTRGKSVYLEIDIPQSLAVELDWKVLPIGEVSTIMIASPHKSTPPKSEGEGTMTMEVRNLLSQVMLDTSGHGSNNLTLRRPNPVVILMPPPHKPKELLPLVETSSQVSTEMADASLEGIQTSISPIAMTTRSGSITPPARHSWVQENANKALKELLTTKASIDTHRQRAIWELGMELHQNESQATESIKEARAVCSWVTLDAKALCFATVKEAKAICSHVTLDTKALCLAMVKEAKMTWAHTIQEAKAACSMAIRDAEIQRASQAELLQREHGKIMQDLEAQVIWEEGRSQAESSPPAKLLCMPAQQSSRAHWWLPTMFYWGRHLHPTHSSDHKGPLQWRNSLTSAAPPAPVPKQSPRPKRWHPSPDPVESTPLGGTTSKTTLEGPPAPSSERSCLGTKCSNQAMQRHLARTLTW